MIDIRPGMTYGETLAAKRKEREARKAAKEANLRAARDNDAISQIVAELGMMFAELDAKMLANQKAWVAGRAAAIKNFINDPANKTMRREKGEYAYYAKLFAISGGKTWYGIINGRNAAMLNEFVEKNCAAVADKRNSMITRKLVELGVDEIIDTKVGYTSDGFHGSFKIETRDHGCKVVTIQTIYAGGYNIQCYHQRTLVNVR